MTVSHDYWRTFASDTNLVKPLGLGVTSPVRRHLFTNDRSTDLGHVKRTRTTTAERSQPFQHEWLAGGRVLVELPNLGRPKGSCLALRTKVAYARIDAHASTSKYWCPVCGGPQLCTALLPSKCRVTPILRGQRWPRDMCGARGGEAGV